MRAHHTGRDASSRAQGRISAAILRPAVLLLAVIAAIGCARVETEQPLPWFKIKTTRHPGFGGYSGSSSGQIPYVKRYGLYWKKLDGCLGGTVLDPETVAVFCSDRFHSGIALVRRGEPAAIPACGAYSITSQILPDRSAVDCSELLAGDTPIVPTRLRYRRIAPTRQTLLDTTLSIDEPGRAFVGPVPRFYGDGGRPYFVAATADWSAPPDCRLLTVERGELVEVAAAPGMSRAECSDAVAWSRRTGLSLLKP